MSINKVILIGNVGKDPDVKYMDNNIAVANFSLATTERGYTLSNGTQVPERTEWHNIVLWRGLAQIAERYVKKGSKIYIEGKIRTRSYDDANGVKRYVTEIYGENMELLDRLPNVQQPGMVSGGSVAQPAQPAAASTTAYQQPAASQPSAFSESSDADDLPF